MRDRVRATVLFTLLLIRAISLARVRIAHFSHFGFNASPFHTDCPGSSAVEEKEPHFSPHSFAKSLVPLIMLIGRPLRFCLTIDEERKFPSEKA